MNTRSQKEISSCFFFLASRNFRVFCGIFFYTDGQEVKKAMPHSDGYVINERLLQLQLLFWQNPGQRYRTREIADILNVSEDTVTKDLDYMSGSGRLPLVKEGWYWRLMEGARFELMPVKFDLAEGTALFLAARLLSQIHDERNEHVLLALTKLIAGMPATLVPHLRATVHMARQHQEKQQDKSGIFEALALGWATHRQVRLVYQPPRLRSFSCLFSPYLLEPSPVGRTIYAMGFSTPPDALRTYKMERIEHAKLAETSFEISADFDGPALLARAWGVMYGDEEPVQVRLRFSHWVTKRVKETLWHPTQQIQDVPEGCEWTAMIGDIVEIANWVRGWGADCEVLEPQQLRDDLTREARRLARIYHITQEQTSDQPDDGPDMDLLSNVFGE
jgi:predicted DNA-binding transcriptional regulator YafY